MQNERAYGAVALLESLKGQQSLHEQKSGTYERQQLDKCQLYA